MNGAASYLGWSWLSISVPNLIVILVRILLLVLAIASVPEGSAPQMTTTHPERAVQGKGSPAMWTSRLCRGLDVDASLPPTKLLAFSQAIAGGNPAVPVAR